MLPPRFTCDSRSTQQTNDNKRHGRTDQASKSDRRLASRTSQVASGEHPGLGPGSDRPSNCQSKHIPPSLVARRTITTPLSHRVAATIAIPTITVSAPLVRRVPPVGFLRRLDSRRRDSLSSITTGCAPLVWKPSLAQSPSPTMYIHRGFHLLPAQRLRRQRRILVQTSTTMTTLPTKRMNHRRPLRAKRQKLSTRML